MIKLNNINKYYFKGERHQIHVVNDVTLEFPKSGFVTILGASGSGKTTLLNIIGGLDKYDSGTITYGDRVFDKYNMDEIDELRNEKIGYIFQNYLLIDEYTVYENLKVALDAINVVDPLEQKKRIEFALECVGLFKYRKKKVKNLSGGQMQRVSIARCIVKNSEIIIADEPTGNIDSENTIQIMNILKKISETKLVILVTHELNIARYYSDRIIQIKDGKIISDGIVSNNGTLSTQTDRKIYLGDLNDDKVTTNKLNFELYVDDTSTESDLIVVVKNDTVYVKSSKKIVNLNESSIELIDEAYVDPVNVIEDFNFDTSWYKEPLSIQKNEIRKVNIINGFREFLHQGKSKVAFIIINIILGILIGTCFINFGKFNYVSYEEVTKDKIGQVYTSVNTEFNTIAPLNDQMMFLDAVEAGVVDKIIPFSYENYRFRYRENFVFSEDYEFNYWLYPYQDNLKIIAGSKPNNNFVVIGKLLADKLIDIYSYGKANYQAVIGLKFDNYTICGVVENETMSLYLNPILMYSTLKDNSRGNTIMIDYFEYYLETYTLIEGKNPTIKNEIIIDNKYAKSKNINLGDQVFLGNNAYKVCGIFKEENIVDVPSILAFDKTICSKTLNQANHSLMNSIYSYSALYLPKNEYNIIQGRDVLEKNECIVHVGSNLEIGESIYGYKIVGMYNKNYTSGSLGNKFMYDNIIIINGYNYSNNKYNVAYEFNNEAIEYFKNNKCKIYDLDQYQRFALKKQHRANNTTVIIFSLFLLGASVTLTYLTNRTRLIREIHSIGVYRSIGKSRKCLVYQKFGYNFLMTSVSTIIGYSIAWIIQAIVNNITKDFQAITPINPLIVILGIVVLYAIGIFIGMLPTKLLIKKTPAEINSKYDI